MDKEREREALNISHEDLVKREEGSEFINHPSPALHEYVIIMTSKWIIIMRLIFFLSLFTILTRREEPRITFKSGNGETSSPLGLEASNEF